jgi:polyisoprenyl-phosphate glycosyltransferase
MRAQSGDGVRYSIVIPIFNEQAVLPLLFDRLDALLDRLDGRAEAVLVDDGSRDNSASLLAAKTASDSRYRFIKLSRNFGHQVAITAGMDAASGNAIIVMDADLQDPPEVVVEMIARWKDGFDVVYARRATRGGESVFKRKTAALFYKSLSLISSVQIPREVGDFRLIATVSCAACSLGSASARPR